jgi:hypothetical protein
MSSVSRRWITLGGALLSASLVGTVAASGCGGDDGSALNPVGSGGAGANTLAAGGGLNTGGSGGIDACAEATFEGEPVPVTMYIMFDKSGSMLLDQKWPNAKVSLIAFFQDDASAGLEVALRFFPDDDPAPGCNETACSTAACATPLVDKGILNAQPGFADPQQQALVDAVNSKSPAGPTPMSAALAGAEQWAIANVDPARRMAVVLVTDGKPSHCDTNISNIAQLAADAYNQAGVLTYTLGVQGSDPTAIDAAALDQIAQAGQTQQAFIITQNNIAQGLLDALQAIRKAPVACTLDVPMPSAGQDVDPTQVNLKYTPGNGDPPSLIPQVASAADCGSEAGWYYDDPNDPMTIELCDASCTTVQSDLDAQLQIVLGCATVVK